MRNRDYFRTGSEDLGLTAWRDEFGSEFVPTTQATSRLLTPFLKCYSMGHDSFRSARGRAVPKPSGFQVVSVCRRR